MLLVCPVIFAVSCSQKQAKEHGTPMTPVQVSKVTRLGGKGGNQGVVRVGGTNKNELFRMLLVCPVIFAVFPPTKVQVSKGTRLLGERWEPGCYMGGGNNQKRAFLDFASLSGDFWFQHCKFFGPF